MEENADLEAKDAMGWTPLLVAGAHLCPDIFNYGKC
jgi:hypothetical protein